MRTPILPVCLTLVLGACNMNAVHEDRPARIVDPDDRSRAELQQVVSGALNGADVMLADDALTESSVLIIERQKSGSLDNPPLSGRDLGKPERFHLVTSGTACALIHEKDSARYALHETECIAE
ncbi:MAG: hypothetical protein ACREQ1_12725 [Woeseiaceae bacterium]